MEQATDAYIFPVLGSIVLVSLYLAFKYLDKAMVNMLLGGYFALLGTAGLARVSDGHEETNRELMEVTRWA